MTMGSPGGLRRSLRRTASAATAFVIETTF